MGLAPVSWKVVALLISIVFRTYFWLSPRVTTPAIQPQFPH